MTRHERRVVLTYDFGPRIGLGHSRRMLALGTALGKLGADWRLTPTDEPVSSDVVVVDSYRWRADDATRFESRIVVAIDDCGRDLAVPLVVDPSPGAVSTAHSSAGRVLAGASFALVDPDLAHLPTKAVSASIDNVVVATGGSDSAGTGSLIAAQLRAVLPPSVALDLAVGPWSVGAIPDGVRPIRTSDGLGPVLARADIVVTAGGVTMIEALRLGRPTIALVLFDNQVPAVRGAAQVDAIVTCDPSDVAAATAELVRDTGRRQQLSRAATALVDGEGSRRVAEEILALV